MLIADLFRTRLQQFAYSSTSQMEGQRRSTRLLKQGASDGASTQSQSSTTSLKRSTDRSRASNNGSAGPAETMMDTAGLSPSPAPSSASSRKKRSTGKERSARDPYHPVNNLVDSLRPGLTLVFIGLNPGLTTAATGHAYAHSSNRFWHIIHASGITPKKHLPSETRKLMDLYSIGNTNICARPTRTGDGLTKQELEDGAFILERKMADFKPEAVIIVGKGIWEAIWMAKKGQKKFDGASFHWGWQDEEMQLGRTKDADGNVTWPGAKTFVATSTSGLAATLSPAEKLEIWKPMGEWFTKRREELEAENANRMAE